ncbi:MAG TPA: hypothetical protein VE777_19790 [Gaiellales bacterium]|nr:hypothetical protein [Gaiellales bacterium]
MTEERSHSGRFKLAYVLLAVVAIVGAAAFVMVRPSDSTTQGAAPQVRWGHFVPGGLPAERIQQIARYVGSSYRLPSGRQLVAVEASFPPAFQNNLRITNYAVSYNDAGKTNYAVLPVGSNNVMFQLCGLGPRCSIDKGKASADRGRLLRREALELTLYTFHYTDVSSVVTFLPPKKGEQPQWVFLFLRQQFEDESLLSKPLSAILSEKTPPTPSAIPVAEAARIDTITEQDLYRFHYTSDQQGGVLLVFDPRAIG